MKKILIFLLISLTNTVFGADIQRHKEMNNWLATTILPANSTTPNKALVFISDAGNVDLIDRAQAQIDNNDITDGTIVITRPLATINGIVPIESLEACQADYGSVVIQGNTLVVSTTKLPISVRCTGRNGVYREFYRTVNDSGTLFN